MKIAVLSGKGGAGKTFVSVNLAACLHNAVYIDCDVEEPNGDLFFKSTHIQTENVYKPLPSFNPDLCTGCRKCVEFCRFNALVYIKGKPRVFSELCHSCEGCRLVCGNQAVTMQHKEIGKLHIGDHRDIKVISGILNLGEASGVGVIKSALLKGDTYGRDEIIDCPPGSACSVTESVSDADYAVLVVEPTAFGFHNFLMVYELVRLLNKPVGVIINKEDLKYSPLYQFLEKERVPVLANIPFERSLAKAISEGSIVAEENAHYSDLFGGIIQKIKEEQNETVTNLER